ncbi:MAG: GntR family transcriptional regulator [Anaerolineae bacterium]|nr:GntR family transcriptional regulator [Anaerolineae bacterium]
MTKTPLYQQIAEAIRRDMLDGTLCSGDPLPSVREMAARWNCTPGTVQRAYKELASQGLLVSRPGQGTHVLEAIARQEGESIRRANLVHQAESFLLGVLTAGYSPAEIEQAVRLALDRWRVLVQQPPSSPPQSVRFVGSHDHALSLIAARFGSIAPGYTVDVKFAGSLGGLIALARKEADVAGGHLWDEESDTYNEPFVRRLLPGCRVALLTLAHRRLGLITAPGNPARLVTLADVACAGLRFVNRQPGAGTRVWLDVHLRRQGVAAEELSGYEHQVSTHSEVALEIAEGRADVGLGIEAAALAYDLGFVPLVMERYDLMIPAAAWSSPPIRALSHWLSTAEARSAIEELGGYDTSATGTVAWVE